MSGTEVEHKRPSEGTYGASGVAYRATHCGLMLASFITISAVGAWNPWFTV